ncbi:MAG: hypothetical protein HQ503_07830 [Rhodospirillales bacterium]|nr:hypothetical protein [Rhodospirillales bacterium]
MTGIRFDMQTLDGAQHIEIDEETAVLTLHSMEQLGENAEPFLDYLIAGRPQIALHLEPVIELYDEAVPFDGLAAAYTRKRNYLSGFLTALRQRQADGKVEIIKTHRSGFGSTYHEPYTIVVWKIVT